MRNDPPLGDLLRIQVYHAAHHRLRIAKYVRRYRRGSYCLVAVMNIGNVSDIDIADVGDVNLSQIKVAMVIPGEKRLARSQWKPRRNSSYSEADGKRRPTKKGDKSRPVDRRHPDRSRQPAPARSHQ